MAASPLRFAFLASVSFAGSVGSAFAEPPAVPVDTILVTAPREEAEARKRQEDASVLIDVQSAETIAKYPDYNAAEALGRIPGISLSTDTGEGRFVNIRGIDANLNGALLVVDWPLSPIASQRVRGEHFQRS